MMATLSLFAEEEAFLDVEAEDMMKR